MNQVYGHRCADGADSGIVSGSREEEVPAHNLFDEFIQSCAFIHDDYGEDEIDHYGTNPFLIGADVCVVDTLQGFGETYLQYLNDLGVLPKTVIEPTYRRPSLLGNLLADDAALGVLGNIMCERKLDISSFYSDKEFERLIACLSGDSYTPHFYPPKEPFLIANDKIKMRVLLSQAGIPMPYGIICTSLDELRRFHQHCSRRYRYTLVKKEHRHMRIISNDDDIDRLAGFLDFPVIAEAGYEVRCSPVSNCIAWKGVIQHLFTFDQVIKDWKHAGNRNPCSASPDEISRIEDYTRVIVGLIPGYEGVLGVDYIVTLENEVLAVDVNGRFNSCTYPFYFLKRLGASLDRISAIYRVVDCTIGQLSDVFEDNAFIPFRAEQMEGTFLFNPVFDFERELVYKFSYLCVAHNPVDLSNLESSLLDIIRRQSRQTMKRNRGGA